MASYVSYTPISMIGKAMFNFDAAGIPNFKLDGTVRVSVSDGFNFSDWASNPSGFNLMLIGGFAPGANEVDWTSQIIGNIQSILEIYSRFASISFAPVTDYDQTVSSQIATPEDAGRADISDINITWCESLSTSFGGVSGISSDAQLNYAGAAGDIFLSRNFMAFNDGYDFAEATKTRQALLHELGHSLGLAHPHGAMDENNVRVIASDYAATQYLGFNQLGFHTNSAANMDKEYFTIMSVNDESKIPRLNAYTPMILDVIALQEAYGEGGGTSGADNDVLIPGTTGYRTYFDKGGVDAIDLSNYVAGAYLKMGVNIAEAGHLVGVLMNVFDAQNMILNEIDPANLRWFYGEYENAQGSSQADSIFGTTYANSISGKEGNDFIEGGGGNDSLDGGTGIDMASYSGSWLNHVVTKTSSGYTVTDMTGVNGTDTLANFEYLYFSDGGAVAIDDRSAAGTSNSLTGASGLDIFTATSSNDLIDGNGGNDTVIYSGMRSEYTITKTPNWYIIKANGGTGGTDTLTNIERLVFSDAKIALDISGNAGQVYRLYQAAFNRAPDKSGLAHWIAQADSGVPLIDIANAFANSVEFAQTYGDLTNRQFVSQTLFNILRENAEADVVGWWQSQIDSYAMTRAQTLFSFSEATENQTALIGIMQNGIDYTT